MLNGDSNENGSKIKFSRAAHIFGHFFAVLLHDWHISQFQLCLAPSPSPLATAGLLPTLSVPGVGHCKFCAALRPGICKQSFWQARNFLSEYNYTDDFTGNTSRLAHQSMTGNFKGMFSILCIQLFIAHQARITWQNRELYTWINVSLVMASILLILFEEHPLVFIKLFETDNVTAHFCLLKP